MTMRFPVRLEYVKGTSAKFYAVELDGKLIRTTWGRLGTTGQKKDIKPRDAAYIAAEAARLVSKKETEGYVRVVPGLEPKLAVGPKARLAKLATKSDAATAAELRSIAKAIATRKARIASKRFKLKWDDGITTGSDIFLGDPRGTHIKVEAFVHGSDRFCFLSEPKNKAAGPILCVRLGDTAAVTWQRYKPFTIEKLFGGWSDWFPLARLDKPGYLEDRIARGRLFETDAPGTYDSVLGLDKQGKPTFLFFGPHMNLALFAALLTDAPSGARDPFLPPDTTATEEELAALAKAIDQRGTKISKRFELEPTDGTVAPVKGKLVFGDPDGPHDVFDTGTTTPVTFAELIDEKTYRNGYGKTVIVARLRDGAAVTWTQGKTIEMTRHRFGFWSPGFPLTTIDREGALEHAGLGAKIYSNRCSAPGGTCSTLIGLDAKQRPVCIIFGHDLELETFARALR